MSVGAASLASASGASSGPFSSGAGRGRQSRAVETREFETAVRLHRRERDLGNFGGNLAADAAARTRGKMVAKEELLEKFQITGCEKLSDDVLEKCVELCLYYNKDEEEFIDMWVAFGIGHLDGNLEPTVKALEEMKRTISKDKTKDNNDSFETQQNKRFSSLSKAEPILDDEDDILGMYADPEKLSIMRKPRTGAADVEEIGDGGACKAQRESASMDVDVSVTVDTSFSGSALSSQPNYSQASTQRVGGSKVSLSFGPKIGSWTNENKDKFAVRIAGPHIPSDARYMFELLKTTSDVRTRVCRTTGLQINTIWSEQKKDEETIVTWNVRTRQQKSYRTWGRVCFESETKQNNPTAMLEGCRKPPRPNNTDAKHWPQVEMDVSSLRECCLFPGQIIAVEGLNVTESLLKVQDIFTGSFIPAAKPPRLATDLKVVVAAGPFTASDDLNYLPLWELMAQVAEDEPHILILIGPFLDHTHPHVQNDLLNCTYQEFFIKLVTKIKNHIVGKCTQVVLVASSQDVHHHAVYPTPEYFLPKSLHTSDLHVLPDPCVLDIEGLRLGITSIDCLKHLGREEVTLKPSGTDKLSRLGSYILNQACFYPLYPPAKEINIDSELWEKYAFLKEKPHVLLLPSDMRHFCKCINESVILNPERLSKRSYARMNFKPTEGTWALENNISCEVVKM